MPAAWHLTPAVGIIATTGCGRIGVAMRVLDIDGVNNFRDIGDYATGDGRRVVPGLIFRCGEMSRLSEQGRLQLAALRIRGVHDLRSPAERKAAPLDHQR